MNVKICVGYHKPSFLLQGDCFVPIWGGKAIAKSLSKDGNGLSSCDIEWMNTHCIGDDSGDNISQKNRKFCEASVIYWMWKHYDELGDPDYIGFLQYRRHWIFNNELIKNNSPNKYHFCSFEKFPNKYQDTIGLNEKAIKDILKNSDGICCRNNNSFSVREWINQGRHKRKEKFYQIGWSIIEKDWPEYAPAMLQYLNGNTFVWSNCFVLKKEDFLKYCSFLFDVLNKLDASIENEYKYLGIDDTRVVAYLSEYMLGIYITYLTNKGLHFYDCPVSYIRNPFESFSPSSKYIQLIEKCAIPIVYICDRNSIKIASVSIQSLVHNSNSNNKYDIIIIEDGSISNDIKDRLSANTISNFTIRFFDASYYIQKYKLENFFCRKSRPINYIKLFLHEIMPNYERAVFLSNDIIALKDIRELYDQSLEGNLIGAVVDFVFTRIQSPYWEARRAYVTNNNKMNNVNQYINSCVIMFDLESMRHEINLNQRLIEEGLFNHKDRVFLDQDVLNFVFENRVKILSYQFNFQFSLLLSAHRKNTPFEAREELLKLLNSKAISLVQFNGNEYQKPWSDFSFHYLTDIWWNFARKSPFYEEFKWEIYKRELTSDSVSIYQILIKVFNIFKFFSFGKSRSRYKTVIKNIKLKINYIKTFINERKKSR